MAARATSENKKRRNRKIDYLRARIACKTCQKRKVRCEHGQVDSGVNRTRIDVPAKQPCQRIKRACDSCRRLKTQCIPTTENSCSRCNRLQLEDCNFEVKEASQDKLTSQIIARPLPIPPSGEPEHSTIEERGPGTFAPAMASQELHTWVTIDCQQESSVVCGLSVTKRSPASRLNALFEPSKTDNGNVFELLENLPFSGSGANAPPLSVAAPPITPESEYWHYNGTPQLLEPLGDNLSSYQLSSTLLPYTAPHVVEASVVHFLSDTSQSGVGYPPSRVGDANRDWQLQQYQMLNEQQSQQREILLALQSTPGHRLPM